MFYLNVFTYALILYLTLLMEGDVPHTPSNGVYISQLIRFAKVSSHLADFNDKTDCHTSPTGLSVS